MQTRRVSLSFADGRPIHFTFNVFGEGRRPIRRTELISAAWSNLVEAQAEPIFLPSTQRRRNISTRNWPRWSATQTKVQAAAIGRDRWRQLHRCRDALILLKNFLPPTRLCQSVETAAFFTSSNITTAPLKMDLPTRRQPP